MAKQLGPLEVTCDAPPYPIVRACCKLGIQTPEDVRWSRMGQFLNEHAGWPKTLSMDSWRLLLEINPPGVPTCSCGQKLPLLEKCTFTFLSGNEVSYLMGQCSRCRTVFWEEA
ncbi:MAG: hypothetical protein JO112_21100 [Planctomycetes bacterium]|nr:hypothetical protein [Planctomycetota bacterium]